jgi:hypothetical protein
MHVKIVLMLFELVPLCYSIHVKIGIPDFFFLFKRRKKLIKKKKKIIIENNKRENKKRNK